VQRLVYKVKTCCVFTRRESLLLAIDKGYDFVVPVSLIQGELFSLPIPHLVILIVVKLWFAFAVSCILLLL